MSQLVLTVPANDVDYFKILTLSKHVCDQISRITRPATIPMYMC